MFPTFHFKLERWKYNKTFELYVSNMGHIRNKSKADIAPKIMSNGYVVVYVYGSLNQYMLLHRVVMLTWRPTPEAEKLTVDHLDHNKRNNALSNLEWVTQEENIRRAEKDYVGNVNVYKNILGCKQESVCPLAAVPTKMKQSEPAVTNKQKRRLATKARIDYIASAIEYRVEVLPTITKKGIQPFTVPAGEKGRREIARKFVEYKLGGYTPSRYWAKFNAMMLGQNPNDYIDYCGLRIHLVFPEVAATNEVKE